MPDKRLGTRGPNGDWSSATWPETTVMGQPYKRPADLRQFPGTGHFVVLDMGHPPGEAEALAELEALARGGKKVKFNESA